MYNANTPAELDAAFSAIAAQRPDALLIGSDPFYVVRRDEFSCIRGTLQNFPAIYPFCEFADAGGLISYGTNIANCLPSGRYLRWPDSQGSETFGASGRAANQDRTGHKPQDCEDPWHRHSSDCTFAPTM